MRLALASDEKLKSGNAALPMIVFAISETSFVIKI